MKDKHPQIPPFKPTVISRARDTEPRYEGEDVLSIQYGLQKSVYEALTTNNVHQLEIVLKRAATMLGVNVDLVTSNARAAMDEMVRLAGLIKEGAGKN